MTLRHKIATYVLHLFLLPYFALKSKLRTGFFARFWLPFQVATPVLKRAKTENLRVLAHGASAGDVLCLQPLLEELAGQRAIQISVTAFTASGVQMARERLAQHHVYYQPLDLPGACRRALDFLRPDVLLLERAELWPALIRQAHAMGTRVVLVNGHISPATMRGYRMLRMLVGGYLKDFSLLLVRDGVEAERLCQLGAEAAKIHVTGNTKLDNAARVASGESIQHLAALFACAPDAAVLVAGSTHRGEEETVLKAFAHVLRIQPQARLILAPRYVERGDEIMSLAGRIGIPIVKRSEGKMLQTSPAILLDTMGELGAAYGLARLAFVGGSLIPRGGQNVLEPAALGVAVVVGPYMQHAKDQLAMLLNRGLTQVDSAERLGEKIIELMNDVDEAKRMGQCALESVGVGTGASQRCAQLIFDLVDAMPTA